MVEESERAHLQWNADRLQRALKAIRRRPIHESWLAERTVVQAEAQASDHGVARKPRDR